MKWKLWRKQETIMGKIEEYLRQIDSCRDRFMAAFSALLIDPSDVSRAAVADVHEAEARADDLRREIELELYERALIPESRGDVLGLIETLDKIPNVFEHVVDDMHVQQLVIPKKLRERMVELVQVNIEAYNAIRDAVRDFFSNRRDALSTLGHIDERESKSDKIQRKLVKAIFSSDIEPANRILLRDLVNMIGAISDGAEKCADRLTIAAIKRRP